MAQCYRFTVSGRVQGVFFRQAAADAANGLGLCGWVRNRDDGRVEGLACGEPEALAQLRTWLQRGPPAADVQELRWIPALEQELDARGPFHVRR